MRMVRSSSLKHRIIIALVLLTSLIIIAANYYLKHEQQAIRTEKNSELKAIAKLKTNQLDQWRNERLSEANFFSKNVPLVQSVLKLMRGDTSSVEYLHSSLTHILSNDRYENIFVLSPKGELVFNLDRTFTLVDKITISKSKQAIAKNEILIVDFYYCPTHNSIHYDIIAPLPNPKGEVFATLVFRVNPEDYLFPLIQDWPTPSKTAETLLVRKDGDSVTFLSHLRHINNENLSFKLPTNRTDVSAVIAVHGHLGLFEGNDYRGERVLSDINKIPNTNWYLISEVDQAEIYQALYKRTALILAITLISIILVVLMVAWLYSLRQKNIYKELYLSKAHLYESQEEFRATLYSIGDGVITTDKMGVVKQLNPVAEELTGWKEIDAKGKKLEEVFSIINEDTRDKVENPVAKVLKEGAIVGLANHTILISKQGKEFPIADSGAPIRSKKGEVVGVVVVFRDQTEERAQEKALRESEERFQMLFNKAPLGYQSLDVNGHFLDVNQQWLNTLGYTRKELIGKSFGDFVAPDYRDGFRKRFSIFKAQGYIHSEFEMLHKNGEKRFIAFDGKIGYNKLGEFVQTHCILQDITEKRKSEEALKNIEWMLSREPAPLETDNNGEPTKEQEYGDLTVLNKRGLISTSIDKAILHGITSEYMNLLETSSAIYEKNGDYAYGIFSSSWCQLMDQASRNLCNTEDNAKALVSGKWLCHESCWIDCAVNAIETEQPSDIECSGGIRLYGVPIFANGEVVGSINFGYGDPPKDIPTLEKLAKNYKIDVDELIKKSKEYYSRPAFIIELAKKRIAESAKIIGLLIELKQADEKLKANFHLQKIAGESAKFGGWSVDLSNKIFTWSDVVAEIHGEPSGFSPSLSNGINYYAPEWREKIIQVFNDCAEKGIPYDEEMEIINTKGERRWVKTIGKPIKDRNGNIYKVQGSFQDITSLRETERIIALNSQRLKHHIENSPLAVIEWDKDFKVKRWTARAEEFFGWSEKEVINKYPTDWMFFHEDDAQEVNATMSKLLNGEVSKNISTNRNYSKDAGIVHCVWFNSALKDENGELLSILSLVHNVTEQKQTLEDLKRSREFILSIIENLPVGLSVNTVKPTVSFEFMNENFAKFYGVPKETLADPDTFWETVYEDPEFREELKNKVLADIDTGDPEKMYWLDIPIKKDGEIVRYITARSIPLQERGLLISTVWDVTERKMAEIELIKLKHNLEEVVKEKTKELNERVAELERFHEATIDRELRMNELRDEIKRLKKEE